MSKNLSIKKEKKSFSHYQVITSLILFIVIVTYTLIWFFLASKVEEKVSDQIRLYSEHGFNVSCDNMRKTGYPLRIGVTCERIDFFDRMNEISFSSGMIKATAPIYAPKWLDVSIASPVSLQTFNVLPLNVQWSDFTLETDIGQRFPDRLNLRGDNIIINFDDDTGLAKESIEAKFIHFDVKGLKSDLLAKISFDELSFPFEIKGEKTQLPKVSGDVKWTLENVYQLFNEKYDVNWPEKLRGNSGKISEAKFTFMSGGSFSVKGPFSFDKKGYLSAKFEIAVSSQMELSNTLRLLFPSQADNLKTIMFVVNSMPKNNEGNPVLIVSIKHGQIRLGFITLGQIPPI
ncbi:DUF2125 domain-containing protein [Bartonella tamiae]|uniref:DUF2125 domain-containing protein n=1 Tax=Bartonella tamiae Th239 TaxID=1094558 RepID=J1K351_9HYPH|nr:DUF2125 domain-containing protein [Bartonella tamiae]EJF91540.1 hypothetical protein ME5_00235 [Bartonella tamiae Th239]EJF92476.1 hypothetical protein MEG_01646 [Bartonella tamiae Th307]